MYEWSELFKYDIVPLGRFVTFAENEIGKIRLAKLSDRYIVGVTTINTVCSSDCPLEWPGKYACNEYGDILIKERDKNDNTSPENFINGIPVVPVINPMYDDTKMYQSRTDRVEWINVNLIGKCIVEDNGECVPNGYCTYGNEGIARPCTEAFPLSKYYVIDRISDHTILILLK